MDLHWRNSQKPARFFFLDARCFLAILLFLVHARMWTLTVAIVLMLFFWFLERKGLTFESALRAFRCWMLGTKRPANRRSAKRRWIDYGGK
jgi:intracellular multiplication protein IcmT